MKVTKVILVGWLLCSAMWLGANPQTIVNVMHRGQVAMDLVPELNIDDSEFTFFGKFIYGLSKSSYMDLDFGFNEDMYFGANFTQRFPMSSKVKFLLQGGAHHDGEMALDGNGIFLFSLKHPSLKPFVGLNLDVYFVDGSVDTHTLLPVGFEYILQGNAAIHGEFQIPLNNEAPARAALGFLYKF